MATKKQRPPRDWREGRRLRALELHEEGWAGKAIAAALGVSRSAVSQWLKRGREGGPEALRTKPPLGVCPGSQVDWRLFFDGGIMGVALGVTALALVGKLLGCGAGMLGLGRRSIAIVGTGMAPRGEVGLIVASLGLSLGAIPSEIFSVVVIMSILTTLVVPPVLRALYAGHPETEISPEDTASQAGLLPEL